MSNTKRSIEIAFIIFFSIFVVMSFAYFFIDKTHYRDRVSSGLFISTSLFGIIAILMNYK